MPQQQPLIQFKNVSKTINDKKILNNISFSVLPGEIFGIIGSSGAGKTSLMRAMIGFYRIDSGEILFENKEVTTNIDKIRTIMGFASQENCVYDELTAIENLEYFGRLHHLSGQDIKYNTDSLLNLVELYESKDVLAKNMSGGMKRRLDLACSLIHNPKVLIMDEPTTGLDPVLRKHMWDLIRIVNQAGTTIIISSHLLDEIEDRCSRVAIISKGKLMVAGTPNQIKELYSKNEEIHLETYPGNYIMLEEWLKISGLPISMCINKGNKLVIYSKNAETVLHNILHFLETTEEKITNVELNKPSLNEVFEAFTQMEKNDK
jgi:ABC-2 type transport system ATP-binding protein